VERKDGESSALPGNAGEKERGKVSWLGKQKEEKMPVGDRVSEKEKGYRYKKRSSA